MTTATIAADGRVRIPEDIRHYLHLKAGDKLGFSVEPDGRVTLVSTGSDIRRLRGLLHRPHQEPVSVEEMNAGIRRRSAQKATQRQSSD